MAGGPTTCAGGSARPTYALVAPQGRWVSRLQRCTRSAAEAASTSEAAPSSARLPHRGAIARAELMENSLRRALALALLTLAIWIVGAGAASAAKPVSLVAWGGGQAPGSSASGIFIPTKGHGRLLSAESGRKVRVVGTFKLTSGEREQIRRTVATALKFERTAA